MISAAHCFCRQEEPIMCEVCSKTAFLNPNCSTTRRLRNAVLEQIFFFENCWSVIKFFNAKQLNCYHGMVHKPNYCMIFNLSRAVFLNRWAAAHYVVGHGTLFWWAAKLFLFCLESRNQLISATNASRSNQISSFQLI